MATLAIAALPFALGAALGASSGADASQTDVDVSGPFLQHLTKDPHDPASAYRCGEPQITQDVLHPNTLVVDCMSAQINYQTPMSNLFWAFSDVTKNGTWHQPCYAFISHDGGKRWEQVRPNPLTSEMASSCADPLAYQGPHGELYLGEDGQHFPVDRTYGSVIVQPMEIPLEFVGIQFTRSLDDGKTWSKLAPIPTAVDRPFWTVDASTGVIYEVSGCIRVTTIGEYGCTPSSRNLAVSTDQGRTWTPSVDIRSQEPPTSTPTPGHLHNIAFDGGGASVAAAQGVFATAGISRGADGSRTLVFKYSTDRGATFTQNPIPLGGSTPCASPSVSGAAADPQRRGAFAVIVLCNPNPRAVRVLVTRDLGATWTETADLAVVPPVGYVTDPSNTLSSPSNAELSTLITAKPTDFYVNRPWVAYGPTGALGVLWRQIYPPTPSALPGAPTSASNARGGPQDVFVALSANGGTKFAEPIRVNTAASPAADPRQSGGDDTSDLILDAHHAYAVWGDWRSGELETWFGKVSIPGS
jgi:hypothetical protein